MAVLVETCCCGCSLRMGVTILGIFGLIISGYSISRESQAIKVYKQLEENADELSQFLPFSKKHFLAIIILGYVNLAFKVISLLVNLLLLGSLYSGDKRLAYPWLGWSMFELFFDFGVIVFFIAVWNGFAVFFILYGIGWLLSIYFIVVVYSYIEDHRPENNISPSSGFASSVNGWTWTTSARSGGSGWGGGSGGGGGSGDGGGGSGGGDGGGGC